MFQVAGHGEQRCLAVTSLRAPARLKCTGYSAVPARTRYNAFWPRRFPHGDEGAKTPHAARSPAGLAAAGAIKISRPAMPRILSLTSHPISICPSESVVASQLAIIFLLVHNRRRLVTRCLYIKAGYPVCSPMASRSHCDTAVMMLITSRPLPNWCQAIRDGYQSHPRRSKRSNSVQRSFTLRVSRSSLATITACTCCRPPVEATALCRGAANSSPTRRYHDYIDQFRVVHQRHGTNLSACASSETPSSACLSVETRNVSNSSHSLVTLASKRNKCKSRGSRIAERLLIAVRSLGSGKPGVIRRTVRRSSSVSSHFRGEFRESAHVSSSAWRSSSLVMSRSDGNRRTSLSHDPTAQVLLA